MLALAGACGSLSRYWLSGMVHSWLGRSFPWGTAVVNIFGCLLFGLIWELGESRMLLSTETRIILLSGFMGAFTTFSSLIFESGELLRQAQYAYAALNICGETLLGFACLALGMALGRLI